MLIDRFSGSEALTAADRKIISEGLTALLRERSVAYEIAANVALSRGLARPDVRDFGLPEILRLSREIEKKPMFSASSDEGACGEER
ncbi:hypothetical protein [Caballeronia grimmiae]|uniref:hypothetical protein n=1 Tax=Caballeronia grimmiae TaxID=1071679 RepID=UPI0038BA14DF